MENKRKVITIGAARGSCAVINGVEYYFLYDGEALFRIQEEFGVGILPKLSINTPEETKNILRVSEILTEQAAKQCKRHDIDDVPVFKKDEFIMPFVYLDLQKACLDATSIGFEREQQDNDEEVDLILARQKKKGDTKGRSISKTE